MEELKWKFGANKFVKISELREDELFICSKHAIRKMREIEEKREHLLKQQDELKKRMEQLRLQTDSLDKPFIMYADLLESIVDRINTRKELNLNAENITFEQLNAIQHNKFVEVVDKSIV